MKIGCDLVALEAFGEKLARPGFIRLVFHESEVSYCEAKVNRVQSYAARFAAKEAFAKALGTGFFVDNFTPGDVWVAMEEEGKGNYRPKLRLSEKAATLLKQRNRQGMDLSLSHDGGYAMAVVILF